MSKEEDAAKLISIVANHVWNTTPEWVKLALAHLGAVRDNMSHEDVLTIQAFLVNAAAKEVLSEQTTAQSKEA